MRVGLYGGAFNPIHFGHLKAMAYALSMGQLDDLRVLPAWKHGFGKDMAPYEDRLRMAQIAVSLAYGDRVTVSDAERTWGINYTVDLVEHLRKLEPDNTWVLVIGEDVLATSSRWHRWNDLIGMVELLVVPEQGDTRSTAIRAAIQIGDDQALLEKIPEPILRYIKGKSLYL